MIVHITRREPNKTRDDLDQNNARSIGGRMPAGTHLFRQARETDGYSGGRRGERIVEVCTRERAPEISDEVPFFTTV